MDYVDDEQLIDPPAGARLYEQTQRPMFSECAPSGRIRLDALARWLQDVAYSDMENAGVAHLGFWVLRRTRLIVSEFPRFAQSFRVRTFCSGTGMMWAQRRTIITAVESDGADGAGRRAGAEPVPSVQALALWVHLDPANHTPAAVTDEELEYFAGTAQGRTVSRRLRHPHPQDALPLTEWRLRLTDCDVADHINNTVYWRPLEDELLTREREAGELVEAIDAEIEYRTPAQPGLKRVLGNGQWRWLVETADGDGGRPGRLYASTLVRNIVTGGGAAAN
jgi:acyl-ACP thioesterase